MKILVHAKANAYKNSVTVMSDGTYKVAVTVLPEHGKANVAIAKLLAKYLKVPLSSISLTRGAAAKEKYFTIDE